MVSVVSMSERTATRAAQGMALVALVVYAAFRARYVGGCDGASYLLESYRLRGIDAGLALDPSVPFPGALAPLCLVERHGALVSFFPPGYPLLLALGGLVGLELHVNALLAAGSGLALYALLRERAGAVVSLALMAMWLTSPLAVWGSTMIMSDLPSAALLVFALLALRRGSPVLAGVLVGYALGVRPTNALALPALFWLAPDRRALGRAGGGLALALAGWAAYVRLTVGSFSLPYAGNASLLTGAHTPSQLGFLLRESMTQFLPVTALALVGVVRRPRATAPYALWFAAFVLVHALWLAPFDAWWRARFVLPGYPALFLAAAEGAAVLASNAARARALRVAAPAIALGYAVWGWAFSPASPHLQTEWDRFYERDARRVARLVPDDALVGTVNYGSPLRLYADLQSFYWCHADTPALLRWALERGRPVFAVLDPIERECLRAGAPLLAWTEVARLPSGKPLHRLTQPPRSGTLDIGTPGARASLLEGWSGDERDGATTYVWTIARRATLQLPPRSGPGDVLARLWLQPYEVPGPPQTVEAVVDGVSLAQATLRGGLQSVEMRVPERLVGRVLELRFGHAVSPKSLGASEDARTLAASVDRVELLPAP